MDTAFEKQEMKKKPQLFVLTSYSKHKQTGGDDISILSFRSSLLQREGGKGRSKNPIDNSRKLHISKYSRDRCIYTFVYDITIRLYTITTV